MDNQIHVTTYDPGINQPVLRGHMFISHQDVIDRAEMMMLGIHDDILWRKVEEQARKLIWC